ncbi:phosphotriesterase [Dyadobacter sp. CY312]|uniref:phosphotriesterase family protein n=1 Tax=Dyadobacter sp. CY312 TaxID=2907303 RepID=UPI001F34B384|nr:phosphotriesterase [Dyadobacter sp. CY312]MCE7039897.1 phosphotriesterase [Dyadobacter sp. CY312]
MFSRRLFIQTCFASPLLLKSPAYGDTKIVTLSGEINASKLGRTLIHEHVLVDFIGADKINPNRWEHDQVIKKVLPYLLDIKAKGIKTIVECTPAFLGRDVKLLQKLAHQSGLQILTNTGFYGASDNKYLPSFALTETATELANRWIAEFKRGIDGTDVKPGFIKIGVNPGSLSDLHKKLISAAAIAHLQTGLTIYSHTGPAIPAFEQLEILKQSGVHPSAFVWVHANGSDEDFLKIAKMGAWISLDGIDDGNMDKNAKTISLLKSSGLLNKVLISHDAGWYKPGEPDGGAFKGFTTISDKFIPYLKSNGFKQKEIDQILINNPSQMLAIQVRKM